MLSDACTTCPGDVALYRQATFQSVDLDVRLLYGDSRTGTHASGLIGRDEVGIAGFTLEDQYFAAINNTNTSVEETDSAGIFGLGFPVNRFRFSLDISTGSFILYVAPVSFGRSPFVTNVLHRGLPSMKSKIATIAIVNGSISQICPRCTHGRRDPPANYRPRPFLQFSILTRP